MPGIASDPRDGSPVSSALVPFSPDARGPAAYPLHHGLKPPISRLAISWGRGNSLRVSFFRRAPADDSDGDEVGGKVLEVRLSSGDGDISDPQSRRIAYGSVSPFALLQSRRNSVASLSKMSSPYHVEWWEYVMEYSKDINSLLGDPKSLPTPVIEDPKGVMQDYNGLLSSTQATVSSKLVDFQKELVTLQIVEDNAKYWEVLSSTLAVGWLDVVVKMLRLHGSYQLDQIGNRETENGLVEAVAVLISKMPRMRPELGSGRLGECYRAKPDFIKAWEKWRAQITKLACSSYWVYCDHHQTREGLGNMLQIMLGNTNSLCTSTCHWIELYIAHFLYIRPLTVPSTEMHAVKTNDHYACIDKSPFGIITDNTEIAPIYLTSCMKQGVGLLEILLSKQPVQHRQILLKIVEICRLNELHSVSSNIMKIAGVYHWKHGRRGSGVYWLQQARDEVRLNRIAQQLFDSVGQSLSDESFKQWEGLIELLGSESKAAGGLEFLHRYRDFKKFLKQVNDGKSTCAAQQAVESLISLMKNPCTPQRFWLPLLYDSLKLLNWQECPLLNVSQTNLLLNKLQELSMARLRPDFIEAELAPQASGSVRLALATNLGRAILEEQ
ncbi:Nuclear pore complex protein Nup85 [Morella rubra]|uniref:Nuclear pore complex protein Nup85 n=1 Tax=Morella rubra TaxID=262757 RepID=A0A6A1UXE5_9ROSI|nr:Nuclear pore complex protein Nup85 [Morella rubra]